ncbi:hypothetical protein ONZ45_g17584 [Pleurotus djamor]|nr:hypothetical protein ONZ45_g17584 [Pleurotus djamor]
MSRLSIAKAAKTQSNRHSAHTRDPLRLVPKSDHHLSNHTRVFPEVHLNDGSVAPTPPPPVTPSNDPDHTMDQLRGGSPGFPPLVSRHRRRKDQQWQTWLDKVIPSLILPYFELLRGTQSLRVSPPSLSSVLICQCESTSSFSILAVRMNVIEKIVISSCLCTPLAQKLVSIGLFPCAPFRPTLAVDISLLQFVSELFVNLAPNTTAWCRALESFLQKRDYQLQGEDPLRRRFGNALQFFNCLEVSCEAHIETILRDSALDPSSNLSSETVNEGNDDADDETSSNVRSPFGPPPTP